MINDLAYCSSRLHNPPQPANGQYIESRSRPPLTIICLSTPALLLPLAYFFCVCVCVCATFFFFKASMTGSQEMMKALSHLVCAEGLGTRGSGRKMWQKSSCFLIFLFMSFALPVFWD